MNILMMTNTYLPHVGGVANSVDLYTRQLRKLGHHVIVVSPHFEGTTNEEPDIIRIPAIHQIKGSDFSMILPIPGFLDTRLKDFKPDIVHSHHPFFVGSVAVRISSKYNVPLVFTQHTMYEYYTHYVPNIPRMKAFLVNLTIGYANMANTVIAPSESIAAILKERGVTVPIEVIPTGIDTKRFRKGDGRKIRKQMGIPGNAFTVGYTGRLEPEKNLIFMAKAVAMFLHRNSNARFVVVGYGNMEEPLKELFYLEGLERRVHFTGKVKGQELIDAYHAMDVFVFASKTETQGLVLAEAMAAGVPVVALEAAGVREVVENGINGFIIKDENEEVFANALVKMSLLSKNVKFDFQYAARNTAEEFNISKFTLKITEVYKKLNEIKNTSFVRDESMWRNAIEQMKAEWSILANFTVSAGDALYRGNPK
jgi:glycosyltransferase involved in cell wall biosynthesis